MLSLMIKTVLLFCAVACLAALPMKAQSLGNAGTVQGTVTDPSGASVPNATIILQNRITNYRQNATTDSKGSFRLTNIPPNPYHIEVTASSFATAARDVEVRTTVPIS